MPYIVDRQRALFLKDVVAVAAIRQRRFRSRVILSDNSLYHTLSRPQALRRATATYPAAILRIGQRRRAGPARKASDERAERPTREGETRTTWRKQR